MGAGNKGVGMETDRKVAGMGTDRNVPTCNMKDKRYIVPFPVSFVEGEFYIKLLLKSGVIGALIRGYINVRNLCFTGSANDLSFCSIVDLSCICPIYHTDKQ